MKLSLPVLESIEEVAARQLCCGCGICASLEPARYSMVNDVNQGMRPVVTGNAKSSGEALRACPGISLRHEKASLQSDGFIKSLLPSWGPVLEVWEGFAADKEIRFAGSSGGVATALALSALEIDKAHGVVHIAQREDVAYLNHTVVSTTRSELLERTGSRYAPASPCDALVGVMNSGKQHVFIGKPCDVAAVAQAQRERPALNDSISLRIAFFCAGTPSTTGTLEMLKRMGVDDPASVRSLRYRGNGWPGEARVVFSDENGREQTGSLTYAQSWGEVLTNHKPWRCNICPDHTGEFGDIAVGDPWYREIEEGEPGQSLILVRTNRGREALRCAIENGYVKAQRTEPENLPASQPNLLTVRGAVWGRVLTTRVCGVPTPKFSGFPMFHIWMRTLSVKQKLQSLVGTALRFRRKGLYHKHPVERYEPIGLPETSESHTE